MEPNSTVVQMSSVISRCLFFSPTGGYLNKMAGENEPVVGTKPVQTPLNLEKFRKLIRTYIDVHHYHTALFWADKVTSLTNGDVQDVFWLAQCLYLTKQYHRASHCIKSRQLDKLYLSCRYLAAKCHYESKEYQEALNILDWNCLGKNQKFRTEDPILIGSDLSNIMPSRNMESSICLLRGKILEAMDNRGLAAESLREALQHDIYCYEAYDSLVQHQMLSAQEEREFLDSLPFNKQCTPEESTVLRFLYENKLKKYDKPSDLAIPTSFEALNENLDIVVNLAERHYYNCDYRECFKITTGILNKDPFHSECLPIHIACLVELKKSNPLYYLAHKLVDLYPERAISWFAVGCYYLLIGKNDPARRYLSKATTLDRVFGPAWLGYGHSFAVENEHDQAMAAYFKASQLMKGCHLPLLYIGLEYGLTNNSKLAERFFSQALAIAPEDPFVLHEMGVISFQNQDWTTAEKYLKDALKKVQSVHHTVLSEKWEPLLNNLGHVCRKLKKYEEALEYHQQAMVLSPQNPSSFSSIGYVYALMGNSALAVDYFHKALGLRRDDTFSTTMLGNVIEQLMSEMSPCEGAADEVPPFEFPLAVNTSKQSEISRNESNTQDTAMSDSNMTIEVDMENAD